MTNDFKSEVSHKAEIMGAEMRRNVAWLESASFSDLRKKYPEHLKYKNNKELKKYRMETVKYLKDLLRKNEF